MVLNLSKNENSTIDAIFSLHCKFILYLNKLLYKSHNDKTVTNTLTEEMKKTLSNCFKFLN